MQALDHETRVAAAAQLGWRGEVVGPVFFGGVQFWAVVEGCISRPQASRISGCLFAGSPSQATLRDASLLAAYAPRAVITDDAPDIIALLVDAAVLDQGVVVVGPDGIKVLASAGPRVADGPITPRERRLLDAIDSARLEGSLNQQPPWGL